MISSSQLRRKMREKRQGSHILFVMRTVAYTQGCYSPDSLGREKQVEGVVQTPPSANKWAVKVDLTEDVEDFYEKVPKMAHMVGIDNFLTLNVRWMVCWLIESRF